MSISTTIIERIQEIINTLYKGNKSLFAKDIKVSPTVIENIVGTRKGNPSFGVLQKIKFANENIDSDWLLIGKGQMIKKNIKEPLKSVTAEFKDDLNTNELELLKKELETTRTILESKNETIDTQKDLVNNLKAEIKRLTIEIELLKNQEKPA
jgi:hypothetical protein